MPTIRLATPKDGQAVAEIYAHWVSQTTYSYEYEPPTPAEMRKRIKNISKKHAFLICEERGEIIGYAYNSDPFERKAFSWCAEISVYLKSGYEGTGLGRQLVCACEKLLRRQGFLKIYSLISSENRSSLRFHEKLGYRYLAEFQNAGFKHGRWVNLFWYEKDLDSFQENPSEPLSIHDLPHEVIMEILR